VEAGLAVARGRNLHAGFLAGQPEDPRERTLFERAVQLQSVLGDQRDEAEALLWLGIYHQVVRDDGEAALPYLRRAHELASGAQDQLLLSYIERHLGFADLAAGQPAAGRQRLEESIRLRREVGHHAGVAAGLLALAEVADQGGRPEDAERLLAEATETARACGAHGVLRWIDGYRAER
jgi:tetratricopeptide (TPR) repeat protein